MFLFLLCIVIAFASSLQGVVGEDGAKPRYSQNEVLKKIDKARRTRFKCYVCNGCSDVKRLTSGTKVECKGDPFWGEEVPNQQQDQDRDTNTTTTERPPLGYYKPHCYISFDTHGVVARGCLSSFLDQHTRTSGTKSYNGTSEKEFLRQSELKKLGEVQVAGKCADMTHKKGGDSGSSNFTCWCEKSLCNFGSSLRSTVALGGVVAAAMGVVIFNAFYTL